MHRTADQYPFIEKKVGKFGLFFFLSSIALCAQFIEVRVAHCQWTAIWFVCVTHLVRNRGKKGTSLLA